MSRGSRVARLALAMALAGAAVSAGTTGCNQDDGQPRRSLTAVPGPDDGAPLDEELMLALSLAKNHHHKADLLAQDGRFDEAAESLSAILDIPFPTGAPEGEDVRLDARARLAKLLIAQGQHDRARAVIEAGLSGTPRRSFFLANLYTVKGELHEAMADSLDQSGDPAAARTARRDAIAAFDESIRINRDLQKALLDEGAP
ncbi:tetratricopeptide repeat protein [Haliangium sp.]|uniref:tetratricopeptide repeat protein n=1 Tax=Haliangium sp. TaxID=2663208 RepID=UPI003D13351A